MSIAEVTKEEIPHMKAVVVLKSNFNANTCQQTNNMTP